VLPAGRRLAAAFASRAPLAVPLGLAFAAVGLTASVNGGYFPTAWGWPALAFLLVCVLTVFVNERLELGGLELMMLGAFACFTLWTVLSIVWAASATEPVLSAERLLVYLAFVPAVLLTTSRRTAVLPLVGTLAASTSVSAYALATRLFPGHLETFPPVDGFQLEGPIGYWNALGILAAMGALLAVGLAATSSSRRASGLAAASVPVLLTTLYLTFSRGSWLALGAGLAVAVAVERRRLRLVGVAAAALAPGGLAVVVAAHSPALTSSEAPLSAASSAGHRLAFVLAVCVAASAAAVAGLSALGDRVRVDARAQRAVGIAAAASLLLVALAAVAAAGGPARLVDRARSSFQAPLPESGGDLNRRLASLSSNGRSEYWRVAAREIHEHPWLGGGAGSYERYWHRERRTGYEARNAHNLYLETLAELGPVGLALLLTALGVPLFAVFRARAVGTAAAASAYSAFLVHAAVDWDWQIPALTLAALACGAVLLVPTRRGREGPPTPWRLRAAALALLLPLAAAAIVGQAGNNALAASATATARGETAEGARLARRARRWAPWSSQPWQRLGETQIAAGDLRAARASLRHAIRLNETDWNIWYELAEASSGAERARALAVAARLNPLSPEIAAVQS